MVEDRAQARQGRREGRIGWRQVCRQAGPQGDHGKATTRKATAAQGDRAQDDHGAEDHGAQDHGA